MIESLRNLNPVLQALIATGFTWGMTALVFTARDFSRRVLDMLLDVAFG